MILVLFKHTRTTFYCIVIIINYGICFKKMYFDILIMYINTKKNWLNVTISGV